MSALLLSQSQVLRIADNAIAALRAVAVPRTESEVRAAIASKRAELHALEALLLSERVIKTPRRKLPRYVHAMAQEYERKHFEHEVGRLVAQAKRERAVHGSAR